MITALAVNPKPTSPIYLLPRFPSGRSCHQEAERDWSVPIEVPSQLWLLHFGNAFETVNQESGVMEIQLQAAACSYDWFNFQKLFGTEDIQFTFAAFVLVAFFCFHHDEN